LNSFEVIGGKKLKGTIIPQGAKNEALQIISAVLLTPEKITIKNIPDILDVNLLIELLSDMDVKIERPDRHTCIFQADNVNIDYLHSEAFRKKSGRLRGSVMLAGPLLARFRKAFIPKPGGDKIGRRRLDTHIIGFEKLGAKFNYHAVDGFFHLEAPELKGTFLLLDEPCTNLDTTGIELYHQLIDQYCNNRLVIVSSNDEVEYRFCRERIYITDHKK